MEDDQAAEELVRSLLADGDGILASVARTDHLIAVKLLARDDDRRPQDLMDLRSLLGVASDDDLTLARQAVHLIIERDGRVGRLQ